MGFGQNFFRSAAETLPKGAALGMEVAKIKTDKAQDFEEKKKQRELKKKSSFEKAIESGKFLLGLTKNPGKLSKGFQTIGNAIPDEFPEAKAAMEAFAQASLRDPEKVEAAWKYVADYQKMASAGDEAGAAVALGKFELATSDLGIPAAQLLDAMGKGINDFNKTRSDAAIHSKKKDFELEQSTQQTNNLHSLRNLVSSLEQAKKYDQNTADLEKKIFRIVDLMQIQASKSGSPEFINNTTAKLRAIAPDFIADVAGEVRRTALAKEAGKPAKVRKLSQDIVNVLAGSKFNVSPEDATPEQIDAASIIVYNKKLQFEKDKRKNLTNDRAEIRKAMTSASSTAATIASLKAKDQKALDMFSDLYAHGIDKKDLDFKPAIAFAKELLVFEINNIQRVTGKPFPLIFDREIFSEEDFKRHFKKKVK